MGRWSQYRHRGRGNPSAPALLDVPVTPDDFDPHGAGLALAVDAGNPFTQDAPLIELQYRILFTSVWTAGNYLAVGASVNLVSPAVLDDVYEVQARFVDSGHVPLSDWSPSVIVTISV
jgi:hypothetical protein